VTYGGGGYFSTPFISSYVLDIPFSPRVAFCFLPSSFVCYLVNDDARVCVCVCYLYNNNTKKRWTGVVVPPPSLSNSNPLIWGCCLPDDPHGISHFTLITCLLINISLSPFFVFFLFRYFFIFYLRLPLPVFPYSHDFVCLFKNAHNQKEGIFFSLLKWWDMQKPALKRSNSIWSVLCYLYARRMPSFRRFQKARRLPIFFHIIIFY
jgi:hypothetical protein